jgi:L-histidine Nalpha-methyltransferase
LQNFKHEARWNATERRMEMHLRSTCRQVAHIREANLHILLEQNETIWTESSHKYEAREIPEIAERAGFDCVAQWIDAEWPFAQNLLFAK